VGKTATASDDFYGFWVADNAIDGSLDTHWQTAAGVSGPHWLTVDLGVPASISSVTSHFTAYTVPTDYSLQFSNTCDFSGTGLQAPFSVSITENTDDTPTVTLDTPIKARCVRITIESPSASTDFFRIGEFEIMGDMP
ncbi:MAG TPA: discoidin domain-containing protein, partial [Gammaproteobacteria bacterium]|nr:discoidin domain-containing protein [Gammaproteobacteria bacterium]